MKVVFLNRSAFAQFIQLMSIAVLISISFEAWAQRKTVGSLRLNFQAGLVTNQNNRLDVLNGFAMAEEGAYQWAYDYLEGSSWAKKFGLGATISIHEYVELEASYSRAHLLHLFSFLPGYTYPAQRAFTTITGIVVGYEINQLRFGGALSYPMNEDKNSFVFGEFFYSPVWTDSRWLLRRSAGGGTTAARQAMYNSDPESYSGPLFSQEHNTTRHEAYSFGLGLKLISKNKYSWKLGFNYTMGSQEVFRWNHQHYENGVLQNENAWIFTPEHFTSYIKLGVPLLKGKGDKKKEKKEEVKTEDLLVENDEDLEKEANEENEEKTERAPEETELAENDPYSESSMPSNIYKTNNLIFLMDISMSMLQNDKMKKVKNAMTYMADSLRDIDQVGIVVYNIRTKVLLEPTLADAGHIKDIRNTIMDIEPDGKTHGIEGLNRAYKLAEQHLIANGNNQIILITDGEFNDPKYSNRKLKKIIRKYDDYDINLTVIGMGRGEKAQERMGDIARFANGRYVHLDASHDFDDAFLREVKLMSKR